MKYRYLLIIIILLILLTDAVYSQINCVTDPPLPPVLTSVSVQPETGNTLFTWTPSPSPGIDAYILYSIINGDGTPLDTIRDPSATTYTLASTATKYFSVSYVVAAMRLPRCTSIFSNVINSIFENVSIDTCIKRIVINWNSYPSVPEKVTDYSVLLSAGGSVFAENAKVNADSTSFTLNDFSLNEEYCFVIRANLANGGSSSSNKTCISTRMQRPPEWINADEATINTDGKVALSFTIDPNSELTHFSLERKTGSSGAFQEIALLTSVNGTVHYIDNEAKTNIVNFFRLSALNSCNLPATISNLASNIVLSFENNGANLVLSWNPYKNWLGIVSGYKIFVNTGNGYEEKADVPSSDTTFTQDYQQLMFEITGNEVCFYVSASEASNSYGVSGESLSSVICTSPVEKITVPNIFTPNNDLTNDLFRPVLSFTPVNYHLIITDRQGTVLFESRDYLAAWDGTKNGNPQPQGVCLWFLKLKTPSGKNISRTGTITIINKK